MFGIGPTELIVVLVIALLVLGPKRLPELARQLGRAFGELRRASADISTELENTRIVLEEEARQASRDSKAQARKTAKERAGAKASGDDDDDEDETD